MSPTRVGDCVMPSSPGTEKPCTSASTMPTVRPMAASAAARFTVTLDLPTPPLPLVIACTRVSEFGSAKGLLRW